MPEYIKLQCADSKFYNDGCRANDPRSVFGRPILSCPNCRHYSCGVGAREARNARKTKTPVGVCADGNKYTCVPFGSDTKPFSASPRWVIVKGELAGRIITQKTSGENYLGPKKITFW